MLQGSARSATTVRAKLLVGMVYNRERYEAGHIVEEMPKHEFRRFENMGRVEVAPPAGEKRK
jgi:hypothetical protein